MISTQHPKVFNHKRPMVYLRSFGGCDAGDPIRRMHLNRMRRWFRMGIIGYAEEKEQASEPAPQKAAPAPVEDADDGLNVEEFEEAMGRPDENVPRTGTEEQDENMKPTPISAEEGKKGWWVVTFSDETTKKMRRDEVSALGLLEEVTDGETV